MEETNHGHLGQLLTYAAGNDARIVIWITREFGDEHRAAIDWLNARTRDEVDFYGVEVRVVKIGDSLPAPDFPSRGAPQHLVKADREGYIARK